MSGSDGDRQDFATVPIRVAATTIVVREAATLEVLMVKRNQKIDFFSGAMVFPGGKVEAGDADPAWATVARGWSEIDPVERAPRIAALREAFEECGVLATTDAAGRAPFDPAARQAVESGASTFLDFVRSQGVMLDLHRLTLFSRWLTPPVVPKRFDTWFYLVAMPGGQVAAHDGRETIGNEWIAPAQALELARLGERTIFFPTRMNLHQLAGAASLDEAVAAARTRPMRQVLPSIEAENGSRYIVLAPDDGYGPVREPLEV